MDSSDSDEISLPPPLPPQPPIEKLEPPKCSSKKESIALKIPASVRALNKQRLQEFIQDLDPNQMVNEDVEEMLLEIADVFLENVLTLSCAVAQNRRAKQLDIEDVQLILEHYWNMNVPEMDSDDLDPSEELRSVFQNKKKKAFDEAKDTSSSTE